MFRPECLQWRNVGWVISKLFISIKIRIMLLHRFEKMYLRKYPNRSFDLISPSCKKVGFFQLDIMEPDDRYTKWSQQTFSALRVGTYFLKKIIASPIFRQWKNVVLSFQKSVQISSGCFLMTYPKVSEVTYYTFLMYLSPPPPPPHIISDFQHDFFLFLGISLRQLDGWLSIIHKFAWDLISVDWSLTIMAQTHNKGIQMKQRELSKTFIMASNW